MEIIEKVSDMTDNGRAVIKSDGKVFFAEGAVIGDTVRLKVIGKRKNFFEGEILNIVTPSEIRKATDCPYSKNCGGCALREIDYKAQCEMKKKHIEEKMRRIGKFSDFKFDDFFLSPKILGYRNKIRFPVRWNNGKMKIGFFKKTSNEVVEVSDCKLISSKMNEVFEFFKNLLFENPNLYKAASNNLSEITIRENHREEFMLILSVKTKSLSDFFYSYENLEELLRERSVVSVLEINSGLKQFIYGEHFFKDEMVGLSFSISPNSFFQVNRNSAEILYEKALSLAELKPSDEVLDLYSGVGSLSLPAAKKARFVVGIELVLEAVENAKKNSELNKIFNASFLKGKVEEVLPEIISDFKANVIFLDPPRAGCDKSAINAIAKCKAKKIVYISCNPSTLARDAKLLSDFGYCPKKSFGVDMFPYTYLSHVETAVLFQKYL